MFNAGDYPYFVEIWSQVRQSQTNELGEFEELPQKIGQVFAKIEFRGGGLLNNRPAETVMSKVTHKISFPYGGFAGVLEAGKHWFVHKGIKYDIEYGIPCLSGFEVEVFVSSRI